MATRLRVKNRKKRANQARAYAEGRAPAGHKISLARSTKAKKKKAYPMV